MATASYRGVVRSGVVLLDDAAFLTEGTEATVTPAANSLRNGPAIVAALATGPVVPEQWIEELESLIEQGRRHPLKGPISPEAEAD